MSLCTKRSSLCFSLGSSERTGSGYPRLGDDEGQTLLEIVCIEPFDVG